MKRIKTIDGKLCTLMWQQILVYLDKRMYWYTLAPQFVRTFLSDVVARHDENVLALSTSIPKLSQAMLKKAYESTSKRIMFLDDDGTLQLPASSLRTSDTSKEALVSLLAKLCAVESNFVYLMSSKSRAELEHLINIVPNLGIS